MFKTARVLILSAFVCVLVAAEDAELDPVKDFLQRYEAWYATRRQRAPRPAPSRDECLAALPRLRLALRTGTPELRKRTVRVMRWMYPLSDGVADAIIEVLEQPDDELRSEAAATLGLFLPDADVAVPALQKALGDSSGAVREWAALSLGMLGPNSKAALHALEKQAEEDRDPACRAAAVEAIMRIDRPRGLKRVFSDMHSSLVEVRLAAALGTRWLRPEGAERHQLLSVLSAIVVDTEADHRLRYVAFKTIDRCFPGEPEALAAARAALDAEKVSGRAPVGFERYDGPRLRRWTTQYDTNLPGAAVHAIKDWPLSREQVTDFVRPIIMGTHYQRGAMVRILNEKGQADRDLAERLAEIAMEADSEAERYPAVRALADSPFPRDRLASIVAPWAAEGSIVAIEMLGRCGPAAQEHLPVLIQALRKANTSRGTAAAVAVAQIGKYTPELVDLLAEIVAREDKISAYYEFKLAAAEALAKCGRAGVEKFLALTTEGRRPEILKIALRGLGASGPAAEEAVPVLIDFMRRGMPFEPEASGALGRLGVTAGPYLAEELKSDNAARVYKAVIIFREMGEEAAPWLEDIFVAWRRWSGKHPGEGDAAGFTAEVLISLGQAAVPRLLDLARHGSKDEAARAASVLFGMKPKDLVPVVETLETLAEKHPEQRSWRYALTKAYAESPGGRPKLLNLIRDSDLSVRLEACRMLRVKGWQGEDVVSALSDSAKLQTWDALRHLTAMGPAAKKALPTIIFIAKLPETYRSDHYYLRVLQPIAAIGPGEEGLELIRSALKHGETESLGHAALSVLHLREPAASKLALDLRAALERELKNDDPDRGSVRLALRALSHAEVQSEVDLRLYERIAAHPTADIAGEGKQALDSARRRAARTVAWLSAEIARQIAAGYLSRFEPMQDLLRELAEKEDARGEPALHLAADYAPTAELRALARQLATTVSDTSD